MYTRAFQNLYEGGKAGLSFSKAAAGNAYSEYLSDGAAAAAYQAGSAAYDASDASARNDALAPGEGGSDQQKLLPAGETLLSLEEVGEGAANENNPSVPVGQSLSVDEQSGYNEGEEGPWNAETANDQTPKQLNTYGDALRERLGPAYKSHKNEYDSILRQAEEYGVAVVFREGTLAYEPSLNAGKPGRFIIDPEVSIGALRHEFKHLLDDAERGYLGFRLMADSNIFWELEYRGYMEELQLAREIGDSKAEKLILEEMQARKKEIFGGE